MDVSPERKQGIVQYTGMAKLTIGLAAASISFGGSNVKAVDVYTARLIFRIQHCLRASLCILVINFYENYLHEMESHDKKILWLDPSWDVRGCRPPSKKCALPPVRKTSVTDWGSTLLHRFWADTALWPTGCEAASGSRIFVGRLQRRSTYEKNAFC